MKRATKEHYQILQVAQSATLDEIKKAYRKRAFELHPDLNPQKTDAHKHFQLLNEAYVILLQQHNQATKTSAKASAKYQSNSTTSYSTAGSTGSSKSSSGSFFGSSSTNKAKTETKKETKAETKTETKTETKQEEAPRAESHKRTYSKASTAYSQEGSKAQSRVHQQGTKPEFKQTTTETEKPQKEDVLHDILSDPFARRVFEDIYSEVENKKTQTPIKEDAKSEGFLSKIKIDWKLDDKNPTGQSSGGGIKSWLRKQIDDQLVYRVPFNNLMPGSRIRLQIGQGFTGDTRTVDITLPHNFVIGKPVRLVGMGKKFGKWQGDLYLTLLPMIPKRN